MEEEDKKEFLEFIKPDADNLSEVLNRLIESVSVFMSHGTDMFTESEHEGLWIKMQNDLDFAKFIVSGLMYAHGMPLCQHEDEEDDDE